MLWGPKVSALIVEMHRRGKYSEAMRPSEFADLVRAEVEKEDSSVVLHQGMEVEDFANEALKVLKPDT